MNLKGFIKRLMMIVQVMRKRDTAAKMFFYHDLGKKHTSMGTEESLFWRHVAILGARPAAERHRVCFDDGFRGIWDARDRLREKGVRPTVFVAVRLVGESGYLTWDEIRTLQNDYGFDFQCHTWSHQTLAGEMIDESPKEARTEAWFRRELVASKEEIERQLQGGDDESKRREGVKVTALCFPAGAFSDEVVRRCKEAGYEKAYASYPGNITDGFLQPRNLVQDLSPFDFKLALKGGLMAFFKRYRRMHKS